MPRGSNEFVDTNVLLYELDATDPTKRTKAQSLMSGCAAKAVISSQVAQEFAHNARLKFNLSHTEVDQLLANFSALGFVPVDLDMVRLAVSTAELNQISFWDALIVEAAVAGGCKTLWTEDLNHGQTIRGVKIKSPFR